MTIEHLGSHDENSSARLHCAERKENKEVKCG